VLKNKFNFTSAVIRSIDLLVMIIFFLARTNHERCFDGCSSVSDS